MHKSTLITYFISPLLKKHSIKNNQKLSLCSPIIVVPVAIFFNEILYLYSQKAGLFKRCQKDVSNITDHNKLFDGSYPAITKKKKNA